MKKSLSSILAASMVASMFASVAFAAETPKTAQEMFDVLKTKGIFEGINEAGDAGLDQTMNRAQVTKILVKLAGLTEDAAGAAGYTDLTVETWAKGFIGAATKAGLMEGTAPKTFDPAGTFTTEQLAKVIVLAAGLQESTEAVSGDVSDWAKGYVAAAVKAKLIPESADYTAPAKRELLVTSSFAAYTAIEEAKAQANKPAVDTKVIGAKKLEVTFNKAVDTAKATFEVKKGTIPANVAKVTWNDAKTVATLEMATNFTKGDYTVAVGGVVEPAVTKTVTLEDQKVAQIVFASDKAPIDRTNAKVVTAKAKVLNQYGEEVTENLNITVGKSNVTASYASGTITLTSTGDDFKLDEKFAVNALHTSGVFNSQVFTVAPVARVATIEAVKLYNTVDATKTALDTSLTSTINNYVVLLEAKDQYGNSITNTTNVAADLYVSTINDSYVKAGAFTNPSVDGKTKLAIQLAAPTSGSLKAGKATIMLVSNTTGNKATFDLEVKDVAKVDSLSLSAPALVVAGESVEIPFEAVDQFGAAINKDTTLNNGMMSVLTVSNVTYKSFKFVQDNVNNKAKLVLDLSTTTLTDATTALISGITNSGKLVQLSVAVQPNKKPVVVTGIKDVKTAIALTGTTSFANDKIQTLDQYGRAYTLDKYAGYVADVASSDTAKVSVSGMTLTAAAQGSSTVSVKLYKGSVADANFVANSTYSFNVRAVKKDEITGYEVADVAKLYAKPAANALDYSKDLTVVGLLTDGTKVALPVPTTGKANDYFSVTDSTYVAYSAGKVAANDTVAFGTNETEKTFSVVVIGNTKDSGQVVVQKDIVVSKAAPEATKLELKDNSTVNALKDSDGVETIKYTNARAYADAIALANDVIKVTDQYGVVIPTSVSNAVVSKTLSTVAVGDSVNVTAIINGKAFSFKLVVNAD